MPVWCITLNNDVHSDDPSFWRRRGLREGLSDTHTWYPHCRCMQGQAGRRALLFPSEFTRGANMLAHTSLLLLLWPGKGSFPKEGSVLPPSWKVQSTWWRRHGWGERLAAVAAEAWSHLLISRRTKKQRKRRWGWVISFKVWSPPVTHFLLLSKDSTALLK